MNTLDAACAFSLDRGTGDFPADALHAAARMTLDTLGIAIAAMPMQAGRIARDTAVSLFAAGEPGQSARIIADGRRASLLGAAFAAAQATDNLDGHDGYNPTKGHIGVAVIPALAALGEQLPDLSGPDALAAITVGYEVAGRAALSLHASVSDYHTSGAWNGLGVAAMAARLRRQDAAVLREALGIAEFWGPRSQMMREIANPTMLHDGSGMGAMTGLMAALMAERGMTGAPAITVEAPEAAPHWADLGTVWQMPLQYVKPYPICRWAHGAIDGVRKLVLEHDLTPDDIARIRVASFHEAACLFPGMPATTSQAQYSLAFSVAAWICNRRIVLEQIEGAALSDRRVAGLVERIEVVEDQRHSDRFPAGRWADVTMTLRDGRVLTSGDMNARGGPELPFSDGDLIAKFHDFTDPAIGADRADRIARAVLGLTASGSRWSEVAAELYEPGGHA